MSCRHGIGAIFFGRRMRPLLKASKGVFLEPSDPNPYEPPKNSSEQERHQLQRPNAFDWFFATFLGLLSMTLVLPTTCFGSAMFYLTLVDLHSSSTISGILAWLLFAVCAGVTIAAAIYVGRRYIKAVEKAQADRVNRANRVNQNDQQEIGER